MKTKNKKNTVSNLITPIMGFGSLAAYEMQLYHVLEKFGVYDKLYENLAASKDFPIDNLFTDHYLATGMSLWGIVVMIGGFAAGHYIEKGVNKIINKEKE